MRQAKSSTAESYRSASWKWFEKQPFKVYSEAQYRLECIQDILNLQQAGRTRTAAVTEVSWGRGVSPATLWNWLHYIDGVAPVDRLPALAPRWKAGGAKAEIAQELLAKFLGAYLRPSAPSLAACYREVQNFAESIGKKIPSEKTFRRRMKNGIDPKILRHVMQEKAANA